MKETARTKRDPEGNRRRILAAAAESFATKGLSGARVDEIARGAITNERMLYYYYHSKEKLFVAVLQEAIGRFSEAERDLKLDDLPPKAAIIRLAHFTWEYYRSNPDLIRLINNENLHQARHLKSSDVKPMISPMLQTLASILSRGAREGVFRDGVDPLRFYLTISALGYYIVSNRHTLYAAMGRNFIDDEEFAEGVDFNTELLMSYLTQGVNVEQTGEASRPGRMDAA